MDQKLGGATVLVYAAVYRRGWGERSTGCWASTKTIADDAQVCHSKAKEALVLLVEHGWIIPVKRPGKTTVYQAQIRPRSNMTQVINDPPPRSNMTQVPRSNMTHEQEPINKNPLTRETPLSPPKGGTATEARQARRAKANSYQPDPSLVPESLKPISDQLIHCWVNFLIGVKSERAFKTYLGEVQKILDDPCGGLDVVKAQLEQAEIVHATATKKWQSITYRNWQQIARSQRLASVGNGQPPQRRRQHLPDLEAQFANDPL